MIFLIYLVIFFSLMVGYLKIAQTYNIIDKPNQRSSHSTLTIRGAGIIFPFAFLTPLIYLGQYKTYCFFVLGLLIISFTSFWDDLKTVNTKWRILAHCIAVSFLLWQAGINNLGILFLGIAFILIIGVINAYNFMDGINGITALYSLTITGSLYFINKFIISFIEGEYLIAIIASLLVFAFFNVRKKAKAFAGDAGSVSIAFIITFLVLKLMIQTQSLLWILLLAVYGIDTVCTIIFRLIRHENIFKAHRSHFFQFLANEVNLNQVTVSCFYALLQLVFNFLVIYSFINKVFYISLLSFFLLIIVYITFRFTLEGKNKLMTKY